MRKYELWYYTVFPLVGVAMVLAALVAEHWLAPLFCGFAGTTLSPIVYALYYFVSDRRPEQRARHEAQAQARQRQMFDELGVKLRDRAAYWTYTAVLVGGGIAVVVLTLLGRLEVIEGWRPAVLCLGLLLAATLLIDAVILRLLQRKYR